MATVTEISGTALIGETAGEIWRYLQSSGPATFTQLAKELSAPRDLLMQGVGWLAREGKISIEDSSRRKVVSLR
jgi:hypothetical protein